MDNTPIPLSERIILALDISDKDEAKKLVSNLSPYIKIYKVGFQLFFATGFEIVDWLIQQDLKVMLDLKLFDVPQTVKMAIKELSKRGVYLTTIHGNQAIMEAANKFKDKMKVLAVTVLTSLDRRDIEDLGFHCDVEELVFSRAKRAFEAGCDGVVSSGLEAKRLRNYLGEKFLIVTPGIRPVDNVVDDQKRTISPAEAILNGASHLVIGRPITRAKDPVKKTIAIQEEIKNAIKD